MPVNLQVTLRVQTIQRSKRKVKIVIGTERREVHVVLTVGEHLTTTPLRHHQSISPRINHRLTPRLSSRMRITIPNVTVGILAAGGVLVLLGAISRFIWLPDLVTDHPITLGQIRTTAGDRFRIVQLFVGDGYLTEFLHTDARQDTWSYVLDPDARKAWRAALAQTNGLIELHVWNRRMYYDPRSHNIVLTNGESVGAYLLPKGKSVILDD